MGAAKDGGLSASLLADYPETPENTMRLIRLYDYIDYVNYHVGELEKYMGQPRKHVKYDPDLFESWRKKGELIKKSFQKMKDKQKYNTPDTSMPQHKLTEEFAEWSINKYKVDAQSFFYYLCLGREPSRTWDYRYYFDEKGNKVKSNKPYFREQIDGLMSLINLIEVIARGRDG